MHQNNSNSVPPQLHRHRNISTQIQNTTNDNDDDDQMLTSHSITKISSSPEQPHQQVKPNFALSSSSSTSKNSSSSKLDRSDGSSDNLNESSSSSSSSGGSSSSSGSSSPFREDSGASGGTQEMITTDVDAKKASKRKRQSKNKNMNDNVEVDERRSRRASKKKKESDYNNFDICSYAGLWNIVIRRTGLLVTLLLLQSLSQFILESYEHLISFHIVVPLFLTMLVGAGGNAGNQATVRVIAGLVTGRYTIADTWRVLKSEIAIGLVNGVILAGIGFTRVYWMYEDGSGLFFSALAITLSLFCIVITSAVLGTLLPFLLEWIGVDREMAAPAIQVFMDICGVLITCVVSTMIIPETEHSTPHHHGSTETTTLLPEHATVTTVVGAVKVA